METSPLKDYRKREHKTLDQIATALGVHKTSVLRWEERQIPAKRVIPLSMLTGVPPHIFRPDIYPGEAAE
jgi:transcriptional regulator with XRE-family HTH domain